MSIFEAYDASAAVAGGAPAGTKGNVIEEAKKGCGLLIRGIDWVVEKVTGGWSLLEFLLKPLAGDFNQLDSMRLAWEQVAVAVGAVGDNYRSLSQQLPGVWTGDAADAAGGRLTSIAGMHDDQQEASKLIAEQLSHMIEVSEATVDAVAAVINLINDIVQEILIDAAAGPVGWAKGAFSAPGKAKKVITLIHRGLEAIERFTAAANAVAKVMKYVNTGLNVAETVIDFGNVGQSTRAGNHVDETATAGFG